MNTVYKVIWNNTLNTWVVVSELAKGRAKNKRNYKLITEIDLFIVKIDNSHKKLRKNLISLFLSSLALFSISSAYALETTVTTQAQLSAALSSGTYDKIILGADIPLTQSLTVNMANQNVVIDGNGLYGLSVANTTTNGLAVSSGTGTLTLQNMSKIDSANYYSMVYLTGANTAVNVIYNNINFLGSSQLIFMGTAGAATNSIMTFGDIANNVVVNDRGQEIGEVNKLAYTGRFHVTHLGAAVSFENGNGAINTSTMDFFSGADVKIDRTGSTGNITNTGTRAFAYTFADGSAFELIANQDVLSGTTTNRGLQIGSYDPVTGFGSGAKIILQARATGGSIISGNAIDNSTTSTTGINNGGAGPTDVIYNLATGSILQATAAGILATKNAGNASGIYIRSAGTIGAATGISATHNGTGAVNIANNGTINSTTAGIALDSSASKPMTIDNTGGQINASGGTAINVLGNAGLNLTGGTINTTNAANGITIAAGNTSAHFVTDTSLNINGSGKAISKSDNAALTLSNTHINLIDGIGFDNVTGVTFATSPNGRNGINVSGTGTAISTANAALDGWSPEALDLNITGAGKGINVTGGGVDFGSANLVVNVTNSAGTGLVVNDGVTNNTTTIGANAQINASGATAINFAGTAGKTLNNQGKINGAVVFANNAANTINNNGTLAGTLTTGSGNDVLMLGATSVSQGLIDLGAGNNNVTIDNGAAVASIVTGAGDDTFTLNNLTVGNTYLGSLNAGNGNNTLNFNNSTDALAAATRIQNFTNINFNTTDLTLSDTANISGGNVNLDSNSRLAFDQTFNGLFAGTLQGTGNTEVLAQSNVTLQNASTFSGIWNVDQGGTLTANNNNQFGTAAVALAGTLNLNAISQFDNALTGTGLLNIDNANNAFNFGAGVGSAFTGTVDLKNVAFTLSGTNTNALAAATLRSSAGSTAAVGTSNQNIGNVEMNGGTTEFVSGSLITTDALTVTNASTVKVDATGITSGNLLDQDNGISTELIKSSNTLSAADLAQLTLLDSAGNNLGNGTISDYLQGGNVVSRNTYNYSLNSNLGLNVATQLTQADIQSGQTLTLSSAGATDSTLTAQLTGAGNLAIGADNVLMTLSNNLNSYTGTTTVNGGTLRLGSNNALGATSLLTVNGGSGVDANGFSQTVDALTNLGSVILSSGSLISGLLTNSGVVDLAGGTLTLQEGGTSSAVGGLTGAGTLNVNGGTLALSAANSGLSAATHIASGATVTAGAANALGTSAVEVGGTLTLNAADTLANLLSGAGVINTDAAITLSGSNTFSGTHAVNANGALTVSTANNLGTSAANVNLTTATAQLLLNGLSGPLANTLSGVAGSTVQLNNAAATTLTGTNGGFAGLFDLVGNSALTVSQNANLGTGSVSLGSGSTLTFDTFAGGALTALNHALSGAGNWVLRNSNITLSGNSNASGFSGLLDINSNASLTLNAGSALNAATELHVNDASSTLNISNNGAFTLNNALTGAGQVNVDTANGAFNFGAGAGTAFTGNVALNNTTFSLAGTNAAALAGAGLTLNSGSDTTVGVAGTPGSATLQSLALNGGTLNFTGGAPLSSAESTVTTQTLTANGGTINLEGAGSWNNTLPVVPPNLSILDQNRGGTPMRLISATTASGADTLTLTIDGVAVTPQGVLSAINQNAVHVAEATYHYALSNTDGASATGLYLNYDLSAINLLLDNPNALVIATDVSPDANKNLTAQLTGVGGIVFDASNGALTVTNSQNSYTGSTTIAGGDVRLGSNTALGATSLLTVASGASFNTNTFSQTVGALTNLGTVTLDPGVLTSGLLTNSGVVDLAGGILTLQDGGTSSAVGGLTGAGTLNVNGGTLALSAANSGLSAATHIASGATITAGAANALGTSAVEVGGTLTLNAADTLANTLNGAGV
ncbi:ESPR-type extended signal peptide-containing protein, partial [Serratia sp. MMO-28]